MKKIIIIVILFQLVFSSCSKYQKILKSHDDELKYKAAIEYFNKKDYVRSLTLFEQLTNVYKGTDREQLILYYSAYCYYNQADYILAGFYFRNFAKTFPKSVYTEECQYMGAYSYYKESPRPSLDQSSTVSAINEFEYFLSVYPKSSRVEICNQAIDEMHHKLEQKSYESAKLYYNLKDYRAAAITLHNCLKEFPDSKYREEIMYYITDADYLYANNSVEKKRKERFNETLKDYYAFVDEFPNSKYKKDIQKIYDDAIKYVSKN